jgi:hypothetical protein
VSLNLQGKAKLSHILDSDKPAQIPEQLTGTELVAPEGENQTKKPTEINTEPTKDQNW